MRYDRATAHVSDPGDILPMHQVLLPVACDYKTIWRVRHVQQIVARLRTSLPTFLEPTPKPRLADPRAVKFGQAVSYASAPDDCLPI